MTPLRHGLLSLCLGASLAACSSDPAPTTPGDAGADTNAPADAPPADAPPADAGSMESPVTAMTAHGPVVGRGANGGARFLGVPFAAAPTGSLRWRPPTAPAPWTAPREATAFGPACPQGPDFITGRPVPHDEDCLFLNVWTPAVAPAAPLPVMVFIHGGGFGSGHAGQPTYDGQNLATRGRVVVVTINYRLGQLGFLAHPALIAEDTEHASAGNYGLLDQQFALRWVQANIRAFGGDPANVTIFGESAGAISVCAQMASPLAAGLFHRAIGESGSCTYLATPLRDAAGSPLESAVALGGRFARALGCEGADVGACMRSKTVAQVLAAEPRPIEIEPRGARYQPNVDGYVLPEAPWARFRAGRAHRVPFLSGSNRDEGTLFSFTSPIPTRAAFETAVRALLPDRVSEVMALYPESEFPVANDAYNAFLADALFICPARAQARFVVANQPQTWLYHFTRLNNLGRALRLGVFHAAELPYVFGNLTAPVVPTAEDHAVSNAMIGYWSRFAATGDPNGAGATPWPAFTAMGDAHLELGDTVRADTGLRRTRCDAVDRWLTGP